MSTSNVDLTALARRMADRRAGRTEANVSSAVMITEASRARAHYPTPSPPPRRHVARHDYAEALRH